MFIATFEPIEMLNDRLKLRLGLWCCKKWLYVRFRSVYSGKPDVIYQSAEPIRGDAEPRPTTCFEFVSSAICAPRKIRCAPLWRYALCRRHRASRSPISVSLWIRGWKKAHSKKSARNPRYRWIGQLSHGKTRERLARSDLVCITSEMEGSSNVLSEALASRVPVSPRRFPD